MCYLVVERYSICRCLYYKHSIDLCQAYGTVGHPVQERTVLVGYACEQHSKRYDDASLWSSGNEIIAPATYQENGSNPANPARRTLRRTVKITGLAALRALEDARRMEDNDSSTERLDESLIETASSQTTVGSDTGREAKPRGVSNHSSNLSDFRTRLLHPSQYITSLQRLEENVCNNSTISIYKSCQFEDILSDLAKNNGVECHPCLSYPPISSELQDVLPDRLSDDPFPRDPTNTSDEEIIKICQSAADRTASLHLNTIRMCRNVSLRTFLNLKALQQVNFCAGCFSIIVLDKARQNVATLIPIENTDFIVLVYELEYILRDTASLVLNASESESPLNIDHEVAFLNTPMIKQFCQRLLQMDPESPSLLDLGVVSTFVELLRPNLYVFRRTRSLSKVFFRWAELILKYIGKYTLDSGLNARLSCCKLRGSSLQ